MVAAVIAYDDLEYAEGRQVIAQHSTVVGFRVKGKDEWYELDLTDEHAELLERYRLAGRKVGGHGPQPVPAAPAGDVPYYGRVPLRHAAGVSIRQYWKDYRAWARSRGYQERTAGGNASYVVWQVEAYESYLSGLDRDRARRQQAG